MKNLLTWSTPYLQFHPKKHRSQRSQAGLVDAPDVAHDSREKFPLHLHHHILTWHGSESSFQAQPLQEKIQALAVAPDGQEESGGFLAHGLQDFQVDGDRGAVVQHDDLQEASWRPILRKIPQVAPLTAEAQVPSLEILVSIGTVLSQDVEAIPVRCWRVVGHGRFHWAGSHRNGEL